MKENKKFETKAILDISWRSIWNKALEKIIQIIKEMLLDM